MLSQKEKNNQRTKREISAYIEEMKKNNENIILIDSDKRRTNLSINEGVLRLIEERYPNKSGLVEKLLIKLLEDELNKKIEFYK